jgi:hypothetical protein
MKTKINVSLETKKDAGDLVARLYEDLKMIDWYILEDVFVGEYRKNGSIDLKWNFEEGYLLMNVSKNGDYISYWGKSKTKEIESPERITFTKFYRDNFQEVKSFLKESV